MASPDTIKGEQVLTVLVVRVGDECLCDADFALARSAADGEEAYFVS